MSNPHDFVAKQLLETAAYYLKKHGHRHGGSRKGPPQGLRSREALAFAHCSLVYKGESIQVMMSELREELAACSDNTVYRQLLRDSKIVTLLDESYAQAMKLLSPKLEGTLMLIPRNQATRKIFRSWAAAVR